MSSSNNQQTMSALLSNVDKLTGLNYQTWRTRIDLWLMAEDLLDLVSGEEPRPPAETAAASMAPVVHPATAAAAAATATTAGTGETLAERQAKWDKRARRAFTVIGLTMSEDLLVHVEEFKAARDPIGLWERLESLYTPRSLNRILTLERQLYHARLPDGGDITSHVSNLKSYALQIRAAGGTDVTDTSLAFIILRSLPPSYDTLVTSIETQSLDTLSSQFVISRAIEHGNRLTNNDRGSDASALAVFAKGKGRRDKGGKRNGGGGNQERDKSGDECHFCHKKGHWESECRKKKRKEEKEKEKRKDNNLRPAANAVNSNEPAGIWTVQANPGTLVPGNDTWLLDSGASHHFCLHRELFTDYEAFEKPIEATLGSKGAVLISIGCGTVQIEVNVDGVWRPITLRNVLHSPDATANLVSVGVLMDRGFVLGFKGTRIEVKAPDGGLVAVGERVSRLIRLVAKSKRTPNTSALAVEVHDSQVYRWHRRLGHLGEKGVRLLASSGMAPDIVIPANDKMPEVCPACIKGKLHRQPFPNDGSTWATKPLELIHSDVCGPMRNATARGYLYFVLFIDDYSRYTTIYLLKQKSEVMERFKEFKKWAENQTGETIKTFRSDGGGEYTSDIFENYLKSQGITHQTTGPDTPQHNGVSEHANQTVVEHARAMLAELPSEGKGFWGEAVLTSVYLKNRSPTSAVKNQTPFEAFLKQKPLMSHLRPFGSTVYYLDRGDRGKMDPKTRSGYLLGYESNSKSYRIWDSGSRKLVISSFVDCKFKEDSVPANALPNEAEDMVSDETEGVSVEVVAPHDTPVDKGEHDPPTQQTPPIPTPQLNIQSPDVVEQTPEPAPAEVRRSSREVRAPWEGRNDPFVRPNQPHVSVVNSGLEAVFAMAIDVPVDDGIVEPRTVGKAFSLPQASQWTKAMEAELRSLEDTNTWELVDPPPGANLVDSKWVYRLKHGADGQVTRYKARLVARGFSQIPGIDFDETFAPVAKLPTVRSVGTLAAVEDWELIQLDFMTAYLNSELKHKVYMQVPKGLMLPPGSEGKVLLLRKALYGLKQSGREWNQNLTNTLMSDMKFYQSQADHSLFILRRDGAPQAWVLAWVDDLIVSGPKAVTEWIKRELATKYRVTDGGDLKFFVGLEVLRDRANRRIWLGQTAYVDKILKELGFDNSRSVTTPLDNNVSITKIPPDGSAPVPGDKKWYQRAMGFVMFLMLLTRFDICFSVAALSRFSSNPMEHHIQFMKRLIRFIRGTRNLGLVLGRRDSHADRETTLQGYMDSNYGGTIDDRHSTSGYVFQIGGGTVSWSAKKQPTVATSTTEAEYMAASHATKEAIWLRLLLNELGYPQAEPTLLHCDNQGAIALIKNPEFHARSKHIDIQHHFVRERWERKEIVVDYVQTDEQKADIMTKSLGKEKHWKFVKELGMMERAKF